MIFLSCILLVIGISLAAHGNPGGLIFIALGAMFLAT